MACPPAPVKVLFSKISGLATEHQRLPAVTPLTSMSLFSMSVVPLVVIVSLPLGTWLTTPESMLQPEKLSVGQPTKDIPMKAPTFLSATFAPMTVVPCMENVAGAAAEASNSKRYALSDGNTQVGIL